MGGPSRHPTAGGRRRARLVTASRPPLAVRLRVATAADVAAIAAIESVSFVDPWPPEAFLGLIGQPHVDCTVAETPEGTMAGYCVVLHAGPEGDLANLATAPEVRGRRVADALLTRALDAAAARGAAALFLEVREGNAPARALYARHGFLPVGRRPRYYRHPTEDALVLRRDLPAPSAAAG